MFTKRKPPPGSFPKLDGNHPIRTGDIAMYWCFNECGGTTVYDICQGGTPGGQNAFQGTGTPLNGTINSTSAITRTASLFGVGLTNNASSDITLAGSGFGTLLPFSFDAYIQPTSISGNNYILGGGSNAYGMYLSSGKVAALLNGVSKIGNTTLTVGQWYHIGIVMVGGTTNTKIYVNGVLDNSLSGSGTMQITRLFSAAAGNNYFAGTCDYIRVWNRALTAQEMQYLRRNPHCVLLERPIRPFAHKSSGSIATGTAPASSTDNGIPAFTASGPASSTDNGTPAFLGNAPGSSTDNGLTASLASAAGSSTDNGISAFTASGPASSTDNGTPAFTASGPASSTDNGLPASLASATGSSTDNGLTASLASAPASSTDNGIPASLASAAGDSTANGVGSSQSTASVGSAPGDSSTSGLVAFMATAQGDSLSLGITAIVLPDIIIPTYTDTNLECESNTTIPCLTDTYIHG